MPSRKRAAPASEPTARHLPAEPSLLDQIRNMDEFAALGQYLFMFGTEALKLPDFGREELETELLADQSALLPKIQMALLNMVSSQRGLTLDQFEEHSRQQYLEMKPAANPFGDGDVATKFTDLSIFDRIRVLHQLTVWTMIHPLRLREKMADPDEKEQLTWRMDPCGYDRDENTYFILDDNRLYRRTSYKEPESIPGKKSKFKRKGNKRRRVSNAVEQPKESEELGTGMEWSCVCVTLEEWEAFAQKLEVSNDPDEQALYEYLDTDVLPEIRKAELAKQKKILEKEKERLRREAVANRKRSSRIDARMARQKEEEEKAAEAQRVAELQKQAEREGQKRAKIEQEREARLNARDKRLEKRELRKLHEAQARRSRATSTEESSSRRKSARNAEISARIAKERRYTANEWAFDCVCGVHGMNYEDGSEIIGCDSCDIWQHVACQKLPPSFGKDDDFICDRCIRKKEAPPADVPAVTETPRVTIKLRLKPSPRNRGTQQYGFSISSADSNVKMDDAPAPPANGTGLPNPGFRLGRSRQPYAGLSENSASPIGLRQASGGAPQPAEKTNRIGVSQGTREPNHADTIGQDAEDRRHMGSENRSCIGRSSSQLLTEMTGVMTSEHSVKNIHNHLSGAATPNGQYSTASSNSPNTTNALASSASSMTSDVAFLEDVAMPIVDGAHQQINSPTMDNHPHPNLSPKKIASY